MNIFKNTDPIYSRAQLSLGRRKIRINNEVRVPNFTLFIKGLAYMVDCTEILRFNIWSGYHRLN